MYKLKNYRLFTASKIISVLFTGKTSTSSKAKNPKTNQSPSEGGKTKTKIPRMSKLFGEDSKDDEIGQGPEKLQNCKQKFSTLHKEKIQHMLNSRELLPTEMSSLCSDLENLVLYSTSKSTWNKHC